MQFCWFPLSLPHFPVPGCSALAGVLAEERRVPSLLQSLLCGSIRQGQSQCYDYSLQLSCKVGLVLLGPGNGMQGMGCKC